MGFQKFQIACKLGGGVETIRQLEKLTINKFYNLVSYIVYENANREWQILSGRKNLGIEERARMAHLNKIKQMMDVGNGDAKVKKLQERIDRLQMKMV